MKVIHHAKDIDVINEKTFVIFYDVYFTSLYLHALRMLEDREEAKDVVQEVFTKIWVKREELNIQQSLKAYLYRSVRNAVLDRLSTRLVIKKYEESSLHTTMTYLEDEAKIEEQLSHQINSEIDKLPPQMRLIFQLSRMDQQSHSEIAQHLNISTNTVKTQIGRAIKVLKLKFSYFF